MIYKFKIFGTFALLIIGYLFLIINYQHLMINNFLIIDLKKFEENKNEIFDRKINNNETKKIENLKLKNKDNITLYKKIIVKVQKNETFSSILDKHIKSNKIKYEIINKVSKIFDLRKLKVDQKIIFYQTNLNNIKKISLELNFDTNLNIYIQDTISVKKESLNKKFEKISQEFIINESLYLDGIKNNIPQKILIKIIRLFSFDLDFQRDIKKNTKVSVSYDIIDVEGRDILSFGEINYAIIVIGKNELEYFKFTTDDGYIDYFNREGKNVKKSILKTPLDGARLSSVFGMRKHPILGYNKMHKGVDFAAPTGTPVYAGGNGTIEFASINGGYGKYIRIRHNNEYKTAYAHLNNFAKGISKGIRVNQSQVIGYVGSTGRSTGPHLHYEIIYQNKQINPLKLKLPSGKVLKGKELIRFQKEYKVIYANHLNTLFE